MLFAHAAADDLERALDAWHWIGLDACRPFKVTAFADVFFEAPDGIRFLDAIEGTIDRVARDAEELERILATEAGRDRYLLEGLVQCALGDGRVLKSGEVYAFQHPPVLGGEISYNNVVVESFVVSLHISGQLHQQARELAPGTRISGFRAVDG